MKDLFPFSVPLPGTLLTREECYENIAKYFIKCHFEALEDEEQVEFKILASHADSSSLFPTTIRRFLAGSRAEKFHIESSDYDFIYEIGPGMVTPDFIEGKEDCRFYCTPTENVGFFNVFDANKQKLSPATLQAKMFPQIIVPKQAGESKY